MSAGGFAENRGADRAAVREARLLLEELDSEAYDGRVCEVIRLARSALRVLGTELERLDEGDEETATCDSCGSVGPLRYSPDHTAYFCGRCWWRENPVATT